MSNRDSLMSNLSVLEKNGVLVVDSRLVAGSLLIQHKNFLATIEKYSTKIEASFGAIAFETREFQTKQGNRSAERYAYLTEEQSTFLMTLSRNTERVVQCKIQLVKAFTEAKKLLEKARVAKTNKESNISSLPSSRERLENIRLGLDLFNELGGYDERTQVLLKDQVRDILLVDKLQPSLLETNKGVRPRLEYPVSDRALTLGYHPTNSQLQQIGKQAKKLYLERHGTEPIKREQFVGGTTRMVNVYRFDDLDLLDCAISKVMDVE